MRICHDGNPMTGVRSRTGKDEVSRAQSDGWAQRSLTHGMGTHSVPVTDPDRSASRATMGSRSDPVRIGTRSVPRWTGTLSVTVACGTDRAVRTSGSLGLAEMRDLRDLRE